MRYTSSVHIYYCLFYLRIFKLYVFQIEDLGIDWDGPVGFDDDSMVIVDDIESPLSPEERTLLDLLLSVFDCQNDNNETTLCDKYLVCKSFVNIFH